MITKRSISKPNSIEEFGEIAISKKKRSFSFSCSRPLSSSQTTTRHTIRTRDHPRKPGRRRMGIEPRHRQTLWGGGPGAQKHTHTTPGRPDGIPSKPMISSTPASPLRDRGTMSTGIVWLTLSKKQWPEILRRKEVIQPHLPVRLPCYDLVPITSLTLDGSPQKGWATGFGCYPLS